MIPMTALEISFLEMIRGKDEAYRREITALNGTLFQGIAERTGIDTEFLVVHLDTKTVSSNRPDSPVESVAEEPPREDDA